MNDSRPRVTLTETQQRAVRIGARGSGKQRSIAGFAGTGKTTLVDSICDERPNAELCAPTNKAAKVLRVKTGREATTVHRAFFVPQVVDVLGPDGKPIMKKNGKPLRKLQFTPRIDAAKDFQMTIFTLIDEASMLPSWMLRDIRRMSFEVCLIGDPLQLSPVGDYRNPRGIFAMMQHDIMLTEVLRQGADSAVLSLATDIRERGAYARSERELAAFQPEQCFDDLMLPEDRPKMISFTNDVRRTVNARIRNLLGITGLLPIAGEIMVVNDFDPDSGLVNGDEVAVLAVRVPENNEDVFEVDVHLTDAGTEEEERKVITLRLDTQTFMDDEVPAGDPRRRGLEEGIKRARDYMNWLVRTRAPQADINALIARSGLMLQFAHCITAHKSQGSEWPHVVVLDQRGAVWWVNKIEYAKRIANGDDAETLLTQYEATQRWFYTAVTRARERVYVAPTAWTSFGPETEQDVF